MQRNPAALESLGNFVFQRHVLFLASASRRLQDRLTKPIVVPSGKFLGIVNHLSHYGSVLFRILPELGLDDRDATNGADVKVVDRSSISTDFTSNRNRRRVKVVDLVDRQKLWMRIENLLKPRLILRIIGQGLDANEPTADVVERVQDDGNGFRGHSKTARSCGTQTLGL